MDLLREDRLIWAVGATIAASLGLTIGSAVLAAKADANHRVNPNPQGQGCEPFNTGFQYSNGKCYHGVAL